MHALHYPYLRSLRASDQRNSSCPIFIIYQHLLAGRGHHSLMTLFNPSLLFTGSPKAELDITRKMKELLQCFRPQITAVTKQWTGRTILLPSNKQ